MKSRTHRFAPLLLSLAIALAAPTLAQAVTIASNTSYWKFDQYNATGNRNNPANNFAVVDATGNRNHLFSYESDGNGYDYSPSANLPSQKLFPGGNQASIIPDPNNSSVLFHDVAHSGNNFDYTDDFTIEGYFQSGAGGRQDIVFQQQASFQYLVNLNEGVNGQLRFAVGGSPFPAVNLTNPANGGYNNGEWHYFVARYDNAAVGTQDRLTLSTYGPNGQLLETGSALSPAGYNMNQGNATGNLAVGGSFFSNTFQGSLDEIRISNGLVEEKWQLNNVRVAVDTFDNTHDYKTAGVAGTIWDGLFNGASAATTFATSNSPTTAGDGVLTISIPNNVNVGWENGKNDAPFLYRNVGAVDFDVQMVVDSTTYGNYSALGLMVRDPNSAGGTTENWLSLVNHNFGPGRNTIRSNIDGVSFNQDFNVGSIDNYLRIVREGDLFSLFARETDGALWTLLGTRLRPDLAGDVQVGLWYGLFGGGNAGTANVQNFILYTEAVPEPSSLALAGLGLALAVVVRRRRAKR